MIGNPVGMVCVLKDGGRDMVCRVTSAAMRQTTGCVPELDLTVRLDKVVEEASCELTVPPYKPRIVFVPHRPGKWVKAKQVIFNPPATVVLWADGTKTVVKCDPDDEFDQMTGVALCYMKKALGNTSRELNKALRQAKGVKK
jgi:hypothetical protein